jgi:hypothetical protein
MNGWLVYTVALAVAAAQNATIRGIQDFHLKASSFTPNQLNADNIVGSRRSFGEVVT